MAMVIWEPTGAAEQKPGLRGRFPAGMPLFFIESPRPRMKQFRLWSYLSWHDQRRTDFDTLSEAQDAAEAMARDWLSTHGLRAA